MEGFFLIASIMILVVLRYFICKLDRRPFSSELELPSKERWKDLLILFFWGGVAGCLIVLGMSLFSLVNNLFKFPEEWKFIGNFITIVGAIILTIYIIRRRYKTK